MTKLIISFCLLLGTVPAAADLGSERCDIAVPKATSVGLYEWTLRDEALQTLVNAGYGPYNVDNLGEVTQGLYLDWGFYTENHWYGDTTVYRAAVKRRSNHGDVLLGAASSSRSLVGALAELPHCGKR